VSQWIYFLLLPHSFYSLNAVVWIRFRPETIGLILTELLTKWRLSHEIHLHVKSSLC
jgi:hypothetical protein